MKKYVFRKYNKKYPKLFNQEKIKLEKILPKAKIEHVGSTSIPGLGGKPIVDVMIIVPKKSIINSKKLLEKKGYFHPEVGSEKDRIFFQKDNGLLFWKRRVHIHLTSKNTPPYLRAVAFREYMKRNLDMIEEYAKIKKRSG